MQIKLLKQHIHFVFSVDDEYYRIDFDLDDRQLKWSMQVVNLGQNITVYSTTMNVTIDPDKQLAEDIMKTYASRGTTLDAIH